MSGADATALLTREERRAFAQRRTLLPIVLLASVVLAYAGMVTLAVAVPLLVAPVPAVACGLLIGMMFVIGHDAGHNSLTPYRWLNHTLGRIAFLPSLHAFSLWDLSHNRTHHRYNNIRGVDYVWEPMTHAEYDSCTPLRRALYRFYRTPVGVAFYYAGQLWAKRLFVPWSRVVRPLRVAYVLDAALVLGFLAVQCAAVIAIGDSFGHAAWQSVAFGVVLPFLVWNAFMSFAIFLHHTHPAITWYQDEATWAAQRGALHGTVCVRFPFPFNYISLGIMEHNAHHLASGVPLYHLSRMQRSLEDRGALVTWQFSWRGYARICRRCKLYDYAADRWVGFAHGG